MNAFVILCIFAFIGTFLSKCFNIPIPGSVLGSMIFFIYALATRGFKIRFIEQTNLLLTYIALLILPLCIKLVDSYQQFLHNAVGIIVSLVISTICGSMVTGIIFNIFLRRENRKHLHRVLYQTIRKKKRKVIKPKSL